MLRKACRSACKDVAKFCFEAEKLINEHHFEESGADLLNFIFLLFPLQLIVAMSVLEGVGAQLCPDADVLKAAMPYSFVASKLVRLALSRDG
ncbi:hypothetical protein Emag_003045 [Eimeria magna]